MAQAQIEISQFTYIREKLIIPSELKISPKIHIFL